MTDILTALAAAPLANLLVLIGASFIALALLGRWKNWFALSGSMRHVSGGVGIAMVVAGGAFFARADASPPESITDIDIIVNAANPTQPTTIGKFYIDGKYMGSITQNRQGGGRLAIGPLSRGKHRFTMDLEFDPPFNATRTFSCAGAFVISEPTHLVPQALPNSSGGLADCLLLAVR